MNDILDAYLRDTAKARILNPDGTYTRPAEAADASAYDVQGTLVQRVINEPEVIFPLSALPKKYRKYLTQYGRVDPQG